MEPDYENEVTNPLDTVRETKRKSRGRQKVDATKNTQKLGKAVKNIGSTLSILALRLSPLP